MLKALREFVIRLFLKEKPKGVMTTLPNKELVDMNVQIVAEKLMRNGIDPRSLKNANQVENAIKMIDDRPKVQEGITSTKSAKVFDMEGKEIPKGSKIMGGKQVDDLPPPGSRGGKDDIAAPVQSSEETIKNMIEAENKKNIAKMRNRKMVKDAIDNASPGFVSGDRKYNAQLVAEDLAERKFGKEFYDLDQRQQMDLYDEALEGLSEQTRGMPDPEDFAQGGRAGFANGTGAPSIKLFPRARGRQIEGEVGPGFKISERDIDYGITGLLQGDKFFGGAEIDKGKVKLDVVSPDGDTVFKDTISKDDAVNFILGAGDPRGDKFQIKTDKDFENMQVTLRKTFNKGGIARLGFKDGMTRRTFLKILGGAMAIPIIGKFLKPLKTAKGITKVPMIKTDNVPGKPEWFDDLVNKVIIEGDDVTKRFATGERQSIHQKTLDDGSLVRVTEDVDDGAVRVEYESKESMFGEPVQMEYKKPLPDEGAPDPTPEFTTSESGIVGRADGPDDFYLEAEEVGGSSIRDLDSDVSKLKQYATGKGPTMKEIVEIKKRKDKVKKLSEGDPDATSQYVTDRQGDYDPSPDDFASGGIARMLGE
jgi:uncharacterized protein YajQ (UPF0234 family)